MACPFQRVKCEKTGGKSQLKRALTTRQGSLQIALEEEEEDKNTLNLKHLNSAILILTNPPVSKMYSFSAVLISISISSFIYD